MSNFEDVLADFKSGKFLIVTDDANRENEGDLILLAEKATTEQIAFMVRHTSGVICGVVTSELAKRLKLPMMVKRNQDNHSTAFTVSIDAIAGRTTGISAQERANTLRTLADPAAKQDQFSRPGHIFPLVSVPGGLHKRRGHTEAAIALCELTNSYPVAVISELVNDDGSMMRGGDLKIFADKFKISMTSIDEITKLLPDSIEEEKFELEWAKLPIGNKGWQVSAFQSPTGSEHAILKFGDIKSENLLVRIHSECLTGDVFGSLRCDCGPQLNQAIAEIEKNGSGLIIYLRDHEGRGIGLAEKIRAYTLQDGGEDTVQANISLGHEVDARTYEDAVKIISQLGLSRIKLLTNNPAKVSAFDNSGIQVSTQSLKVSANEFNRRYLETKRDLLNHNLGEI